LNPKQGEQAMSDDAKLDGWRDFLSPLKLSLLVINAVCFGGTVVLLAMGREGGPLVLLTVATGLSLAAGATGAIVAARRLKKGILFLVRLEGNLQ